jgi:hypothetical protein
MTIRASHYFLVTVLILCAVCADSRAASLALKVISCPHDFSFVSGLAPQDTCSISSASVVDSALLAQCNSVSNADSLDPTVIVYGVSHKNQSCIKDTVAWNTGLSSRTTSADTMTSSEWAGKSASFTYYRTFRVTGIVQELLNRSDWQSGDSLAFMFVSDSAVSRLKQRSFAPIDNASRGDSLLIWYHASAAQPGTCVLMRKN